MLLFKKKKEHYVFMYLEDFFFFLSKTHVCALNDDYAVIYFQWLSIKIS